MLARRTSLAEELEKKIFGPRQVGVNGDADTGQENDTLSNANEPTRQLNRATWVVETKYFCNKNERKKLQNTKTVDTQLVAKKE